jgi:hypothetical protein
MDVLTKEAGPFPLTPGTPGPFYLANTLILQNKFKQVGFENVKIDILNFNFRWGSAEAHTNFNQAINAPAKTMASNQQPERQKEIWNAVTEAARRYADEGTGSVNLQNEVICVPGQR